MASNQSRIMFDEIKSMTAGSSKPRLSVIKDARGKTLKESDDISARWKEYCENMFSSSDEPMAIITSEDEDEPEPLLCEIEQAISELTKGKSSGCDNITAEEIKASGETGAKIYHRSVTKIWQ